MASTHVEKIIDQLWRPIDETKKPPQVFAVLDAARNDGIYSKVLETNVPAVCLFRGDKARDLAHVAPYLVSLKPDDSFTRWLLNNGWGNSWGIFVASSVTLDQLKQHFRGFLIVYDEDATSLFFRYYDPRVLHVFLPTCDNEQLSTLFGPVDRYYVKGEDGDTLIGYSLVETKLTEDMIKLG
ncbi:MAG: DUF4123 domain-containing protein [Deltaproteobacteria bacterium]|nr:DUF4123 domain-containing protein [Deltaproteobacteria bacterium]